MFPRIAALGLATLSLGAYANCDISVDATDAMKYTSNTLSVPSSCKEVTLTLNHTGSLPAAAMGHNVVITKTSDIQPVATEGMSAGLANNYIKPNDSRVLAHTKVIGGGESTTIKFSTADMKAGGDYSFFCSFPGHWAIMKGKFEFI
jgi:azurin